MSYDLERALRLLGEYEVPASLHGMEPAVMKGIAAAAADRGNALGRAPVLAAVGALVMGIAGGVASGGEAEARPSISPLDGAVELAPSTRLVGHG